jgi:hypothetical protein
VDEFKPLELIVGLLSYHHRPILDVFGLSNGIVVDAIVDPVSPTSVGERVLRVAWDGLHQCGVPGKPGECKGCSS